MKTEPVSTTEILNADESGAAIEALGGLQFSDYNLTEKIGAGGYGEVWRAIGPGGLPKAVKILYGERSGQHAEAEMKALERMRDLRHPFLLSIERIEVFNSRLMVVTELADGNLAECFQNHRKKGQNGIPRDELLGYLKDAADALDFMAEQHGLQHLDIKPDNILLQGNHAKVGDFGLAKDISTTNVSVINGFTPMFAAPELFEGRPGRASDQYSLAIVYQMMLTGNAPFNGRTAAQLTAQHLRSQPDLSNLQPIDRPVIARALSKNMNSRFDNCRQFVDELTRRKHSRTANRGTTGGNDASPVANTALVKTQGTMDSAIQAEKTSTPIANETRPSTDTSPRRSVVIGAGGMAGDVLLKLKQQTVECLENRHLAILQIDSDRASLTALRGDENMVGLGAEETLQTSLRSSKEYRSASNMDLSWMSRRWLFNIPRSGQVDGIRPLGRLALYDHRVAVQDQLERLLDESSGDRTTNEGLDIYVVASTAGGTGSGMVADLGLMIQALIRKRNINDVSVHALLIHATGAARNDAEVQCANTVCTLTELRHLLTPGLDTVRGFENTQAMRQSSPFDNSYVFHLGDALNDNVLASRVDDVASYLAAATASVAQFDFHNWRTLNKEATDNTTQLRVLGFSSQDAVSLKTASDESGNLCSLLLRRWCGVVSPVAAESQHDLPAELTDTQTLMIDLKLTDKTSHERVVSVIRGAAGKEIEAYSNDVVEALQATHGLDSLRKTQVLDFLSSHLSNRTPSDGRSLMTIISGVQSDLAVTTENSRSSIDSHLKAMLDTPHRLEGATSAANYILTSLQSTQAECSRQLSEIESMFAEFAQGGDTDSTQTPTSDFSGPDDIRAFCKRYCVLLSYQAIYQCFIQHITTVADGARASAKQLMSLKETLETIAADLVSPTFLSDSIPQPLVDAFDQQLRVQHPTLLGGLELTEHVADMLRKEICNAATHFLVSATNAHDSGQCPSETAGKKFPENAWPSLKGVGGQHRILSLLPEGACETEWQTSLREVFGNCVATRAVRSNCVSVVCEVEGVPVESILSRLTQHNPHISDVASRIHLRTDVDW